MGLSKTTSPGYEKDPRTGMVINRNGGYEEILARRRAAKEGEALLERLRILEERVLALETMIGNGSRA